MDECPVEIADKVINSFIDSQIIFDNRKEAVLYFGRSEGKIEELLSAITNQSSIASDVESPYVPIAYPDLTQTNVVHYDFTPFVDIYASDQPLQYLECELINAMALNMIISSFEKVTVMIVLPYTLLEKEDYRIIANTWERVSQVFGHQSMYNVNVNVILNDIPSSTSEDAAHNTLIMYLYNMQELSKQQFFQNDYAFEKTTKGLIQTFVQNNQDFPASAVYYNYESKQSIDLIRAFVFQQLQVKSKSPDKLALLQSQQAKDYVSCLRSHVTKSVCEDYVTVSRKMKDFFQSAISKHTQLNELKKHIDNWTRKVNEITILWEDVDMGRSGFLTLLSKMQIFFDDFKFTEQFLKGSLQKYIFIQFANLLAKPLSSKMCVTKSSDISNYLEQWSEWVNFLEKINQSFISNKGKGVQIGRYLTNLKTFQLDILDQQEYISLLAFIKQECCTPQNIDIESIDSVKKQFLYDLIRARIANQNDYTCENGKLTITGDIINVSLINELLNKDKTCKESLKEVEMYAMTAVEFSNNLNKDNLDQVTIIAPNWQVLTPTVINIQGSSPLEHKTAIAMDGTVDGGHGTHGLAGQHGAHGAHFLGITNDIEMYNEGSLVVVTSGGKGTAGQDGGFGRRGRDSPRITYFIHEIKTLLTPNYQYFVYFDKNITYNCKNAPVMYKEICSAQEDDNIYRVLCMDKTNCKKCRLTPNVIYPNKETPGQTDWWKYAQKLRLPGHIAATSGGNGGNGGVPGKGGKSGEVVFVDFNLNVHKSIHNIAENGRSGRAGKGGEGGIGGKEHDKMLCYDNKEYAKLRGDWLSDGHNGTDNTSMVGWKAEPIQKHFNPVPYIEKFKYKLRANIHAPFQFIDSLSVIKKLENSKLVDKYYTLADYITAFTNLEKQFFMPTYDPKVMQIYEIFYQKLNKIKIISDSSELLPFLKAALFTKILTMKQHNNDNLVVDFVKHFEMLIQSVVEQRAINEIAVIDKDRKNLIRELEEKIREAEDLVRSQVSVAIKGNVAAIEKEIKNFIVQIEDARREAEDENIQMQTLEKELEKTMTLNLVMNMLKTVSSLLLILGPVGAAVSSVKGHTSTDFSNTSGQLVTDLDKACSNLTQRKSKIIKEEVETLKSKISSDPDAKDLISNIQNLDDQLDEEKSKRNMDVGKIKDIQDAQLHLIYRKERELEQNNNRNAKLHGVLQHFGNAITIAETSINIYESYKNDESALQTIRQQIKDSDENIQKIKETKTNVEKTVGALLNTLSNDMKDVEKQLKDQSKATLDVKRWHIQNRLQDLKMQLRKLTDVIENKAIRDHVVHYVDKLEMTMNTMITIYNRIYSFNDQMDLIDFIGDVNTATSQLMYILDARIRTQAEELLVTIKTNTIMWQYNLFIEQLKQATFPLAKEYLRTINSIITPEINSYDHNKIIAIYTIIEVNNKLQSLNIELDKEAKEFIHVEFTSDYASSKPFYVWKRSKFRLSINRILRGEAILLFADVMRSPLPLNAVKFNTVKLQFRIKGQQKTQEQLDAVLKKFRVSLTHTGESYYRCDDDIYKIKTAPQTISYSYENSLEGDEPVFYNDVYRYLRDAAPL